MINQRILRMDLLEQRRQKYELLFLNEAEKAFEPSQSLVFYSRQSHLCGTQSVKDGLVYIHMIQGLIISCF